MAWQDELADCENAAVGAAVALALTELIEKQKAKLEINVSERALAGQLMAYLKPHFEGYEVDVEYNRMGALPKEVTWDKDPARVFPDIIVHIPMTNEHNLLVIEIKNSSNPKGREDDVKKLAAYRYELDYQNALFLEIGVGDDAGEIDWEWV
jgi:hypothetical protein